jgi:hypothetical protein
MNSRIILLGLAVAAFSSCSTAYKTGQTPDDVYFSPAREAATYVNVENNDDRRYRAEDRYRNEEYVNPDDRWLRMRVRNRSRWSTFDDYAYNDWRYSNYGHNSYYSYSPFNTYSPFNNYWSNYYYWNSYYNPYCARVIVVNPKTNPVEYNRVRNFNLNSYSNNSYSNANGSPSRNRIMSRGSSNSGYNNNNSTLGNSVRRVFSNSNNSSGRDTYYSPSSSSSDRPTRTYQPSSSSSSSSPVRSSSSGSSSSGSSSGSRPSRGN